MFINMEISGLKEVQPRKDEVEEITLNKPMVVQIQM